MFRRLSRMIRSFVGFFISVAEDPELILQQNIRDMNDQVPRMNESIAMVKANVTLLEREEAKYKTDMANLTAKVKAAIQANRDDMAGSFAVQLEQTLVVDGPRGHWCEGHTCDQRGRDEHNCQ